MTQSKNETKKRALTNITIEGRVHDIWIVLTWHEDIESNGSLTKTIKIRILILSTLIEIFLRKEKNPNDRVFSDETEDQQSKTGDLR